MVKLVGDPAVLDQRPVVAEQALLLAEGSLVDQPPGDLLAALVPVGVFAGSFELEAAESICGAQVDQLQSLVDKSLLRPTGDGRFFLLETTRDYAQHRLVDTDELTELRRHHADWFFQVARASRAT